MEGTNIFQRKAACIQGSGEDGAQAQHEAGKLTARERIAKLTDFGSFMELDALAAGKDGSCGSVITGFATIDGRSVCVAAQDFTVSGGAMSVSQAKKLQKLMGLASRNGTPFVTLVDTAGARIEEGLNALNGYAGVLAVASRMSGQVPQITVVSGPCAGAAAVIAGLSDVTIAVNKIASLSVRTTPVISAVTGNAVREEEIAGAMAANAVSANAQLYAESEEQAFALVRAVLGYLPSNCAEDPPIEVCADDLNRQTPRWNTYAQGQANIREVIADLADRGSVLELMPYYALNMITAFARINGRSVAFIANNPADRGGQLDAAAAGKAVRMIALSDAYHIPVVTLVDTMGTVTCAEEETQGLARQLSALGYAYGAATVPKIALLCGAAIGTAYTLMGSKALGMDLVYAWPTARVSALEPAAAAVILYEKEIAQAEDQVAARKEYTDKLLEEQAGALAAAKEGLVDDVIEPSLTRPILAASLELLWSKQDMLPVKKHGIPPM